MHHTKSGSKVWSIILLYSLKLRVQCITLPASFSSLLVWFRFDTPNTVYELAHTRKRKPKKCVFSSEIALLKNPIPWMFDRGILSLLSRYALFFFFTPRYTLYTKRKEGWRGSCGSHRTGMDLEGRSIRMVSSRMFGCWRRISKETWGYLWLLLLGTVPLAFDV